MTDVIDMMCKSNLTEVISCVGLMYSTWYLLVAQTESSEPMKNRSSPKESDFSDGVVCDSLIPRASPVHFFALRCLCAHSDYDQCPSKSIEAHEGDDDRQIFHSCENVPALHKVLGAEPGMLCFSRPGHDIQNSEQSQHENSVVFIRRLHTQVGCIVSKLS